MDTKEKKKLAKDIVSVAMGKPMKKAVFEFFQYHPGVDYSDINNLLRSLGGFDAYHMRGREKRIALTKVITLESLVESFIRKNHNINETISRAFSWTQNGILETEYAETYLEYFRKLHDLVDIREYVAKELIKVCGPFYTLRTKSSIFEYRWNKKNIKHSTIEWGDKRKILANRAKLLNKQATQFRRVKIHSMKLINGLPYDWNHYTMQQYNAYMTICRCASLEPNMFLRNIS